MCPSRFLGLPFRLGADGSDGAIDCIHLVYGVLSDLGIPTPPFKDEWYDASRRVIARDLLGWGSRVDAPRLDGDVLLLPQDNAFAVVWNDGILHIGARSERVCWVPLEKSTKLPCFRMRGS